MVQPNDETLSFSALMILQIILAVLKLFTSIITTHSNINTSDIFIIFYNITFNLQEHSATNFIIFHSFSKKFIVPLH